MEMTELSLAPRQAFLDQEIKHTNNNNSSSPDRSRKRKFLSSTNYSSPNHHHLHHLHHHHHMVIKNHNIGISSSSSSIQASVDLHLKDPLPLDWEQCLDLESGKMSYLNRKTLRKSWNYPKDRKLDLELNISSSTTSHSSYLDKCRGGGGNSRGSSSEMSVKDSGNYYKQNAASSSSNMVALACLNCHLLVILSKSSPSCPNCKYVHSLPITLQSPHNPKTKIISNSTKSLSTLSLLH